MLSRKRKFVSVRTLRRLTNSRVHDGVRYASVRSYDKLEITTRVVFCFVFARFRGGGALEKHEKPGAVLFRSHPLLPFPLLTRSTTGRVYDVFERAVTCGSRRLREYRNVYGAVIPFSRLDDRDGLGGFSPTRQR